MAREVEQPLVILNLAGQWDVVVGDYGEWVADAEVPAVDAQRAATEWLERRLGTKVRVVWTAAGPTAFLGEYAVIE